MQAADVTTRVSNSATNVLDACVVILVILSVTVPLLILRLSSSPDEVFADPALNAIWSLLAILSCAVLVAWMTIGNGVSSSLWKWLPPFLLVGWLYRGDAAKWIFVLLLIGGTLLGTVLDYMIGHGY
jgi:hypothetical protein